MVIVSNGKKKNLHGYSATLGEVEDTHTHTHIQNAHQLELWRLPSHLHKDVAIHESVFSKTLSN